ncbi:hypothetical protein [Thalassococcus sp. S3]|uniref:hypothetical protein n=1 Tax=Thalassococcus sp. S3 TaxID=2017482 RepID=UPI0010240734|nr:hypothetical protein [Thalassococcus sp. S3]QBF32340.1 hypothetical protein CFI11_14115 [Thalassococcus sp. S3]
MDVDIARLLGEILALQAGELNIDPYDQSALDRVKLISEVYGNFVGADFKGFREEFEAGYQHTQRDVRFDQGLPLEGPVSAPRRDEPPQP